MAGFGQALGATERPCNLVKSVLGHFEGPVFAGPFRFSGAVRTRMALPWHSRSSSRRAEAPATPVTTGAATTAIGVDTVVLGDSGTFVATSSTALTGSAGVSAHAMDCTVFGMRW